MKTLFNVLRSIVYSIIVICFLDLIFWAFQILSFELLLTLGNLQEKLGNFLFWVLFFVIGTLIISLLYGIFKIISMFIISSISKLTPYAEFRAWFVLIVSFIFAILYIYNIWHSNGWPNITIGISELVLSGAALSLSTTVTNGAYKTIRDYKE